MISLDAFEGIAGCRWLALLRGGSQVQLSVNAPADSAKKVAIVAALLDQSTLPLQGADFIFGKARVLLRRCEQGLLILFCELSLNPSMVDIVIADTTSISASNPSAPNHTSAADTLSVIHGISLDDSLIQADIVEELLDIYTEFLGPLARPLARKDTKAAGLPLDRINTGMWPKLLNTLAARISDGSKHEDFLDRAVMLKTRF